MERGLGAGAVERTDTHHGEKVVSLSQSVPQDGGLVVGIAQPLRAHTHQEAKVVPLSETGARLYWPEENAA
jgi:hypothetical protein